LRPNEQYKAKGPGCAQVIFWKVDAVMPYAPRRDYLYLLAAGIIVIVAALWLSALDVDSDIMLLLVGVCLGILVAGWVLGRKKL
jgi:hypothetical protein